MKFEVQRITGSQLPFFRTNHYLCVSLAILLTLFSLNPNVSLASQANQNDILIFCCDHSFDGCHRSGDTPAEPAQNDSRWEKLDASESERNAVDDPVWDDYYFPNIFRRIGFVVKRATHCLTENDKRVSIPLFILYHSWRSFL